MRKCSTGQSAGPGTRWALSLPEQVRRNKRNLQVGHDHRGQGKMGQLELSTSRVLGQTQVPQSSDRWKRQYPGWLWLNLHKRKKKTWLFRKSLCSLLIFSQGYSQSVSIRQSFCPFGASGGPLVACCPNFSLHLLQRCENIANGCILFLSDDTNGFFTPSLLYFSVGNFWVWMVSFRTKLITRTLQKHLKFNPRTFLRG